MRLATTLSVFLLIGVTCAHQFLVASQYVGHAFSPTASIGVDFTVYAPINVSAIGLVDADARGINGTLLATIVDRSSGRTFVTVGASYGDRRENDTNPFHFVSVAFRLERGVYSLISTGFILDRMISGSNSSAVTTGYDGVVEVVATRALLGSNVALVAPLTVDVGGEGYFHVGATFLFEVVPEPPVRSSFPQIDFDDCESVACAGHPTGVYNVLGKVRFCDSDAMGGGWLRVWRANESTCEAHGWSSARNIDAIGLDPAGCSPSVSRAARCSNSSRIESPVPIREVLGTAWRAWGIGSLGAFHSRPLCDGIVVWGNQSTDTAVWTFAMSGSVSSGHCPCSVGFVPSNFTIANLNVTGLNWSCSRLPAKSTSWSSAFGAAADNICTGTGTMDGTFVRSFDRPLTTLSVGLCKNGNDIIEDVKLASGDLFVRSSVGFDKRNCAVRTSISSQSLSSTTTSSTSTKNLPTSSQSPSTLSSQTSSTTTISTKTVPTTTHGLVLSSPLLATAPTAAVGENLLIPAIAGSLGCAVLFGCVALAFVYHKRRSSLPRGNATTAAAVVPDSQYGVLPSLPQLVTDPLYGDVAEVRRTVGDYEAASAPLVY
jgi:hypothetical protein